MTSTVSGYYMQRPDHNRPLHRRHQTLLENQGEEGSATGAMSNHWYSKQRPAGQRCMQRWLRQSPCGCLLRQAIATNNDFAYRVAFSLHDIANQQP
jgi:hypothetical protein